MTQDEALAKLHHSLRQWATPVAAGLIAEFLIDPENRELVLTAMDEPRYELSGSGPWPSMNLYRRVER